MIQNTLDQVIQSVLYEGYLRYPYRLSSIRNPQRFNFGIVFPEPLASSRMSTECIVVLDPGGAECVAEAEVRFLQLIPVDGDYEVIERRVPVRQGTTDILYAGIHGVIECSQAAQENGTVKLQVRISNRTTPPDRSVTKWNDILTRCLVSTHIVLRVENAEFISLLDPPAEFRTAANNCTQEGVWPVLIGGMGERTCMLASPIILCDYPRVVSDIPENLFDGTETDEILMLRIMSLTPEERAEIRRGDPKGIQVLDRAEAITPKDMRRLHGARRDVAIQCGDRVRLHPRRGAADAMDMFLNGRIGIVEGVEVDFEKQVHLAVVLEDDPGRELGMQSFPGHRFYFSPEEVEVLR